MVTDILIIALALLFTAPVIGAFIQLTIQMLKNFKKPQAVSKSLREISVKGVKEVNSFSSTHHTS